MSSRTIRTRVTALAVGVAAAAALATTSAGATTAAPATTARDASAQAAGFAPGSRDDAQNSRLAAKLAQAKANAAKAKPGQRTAAVTVYFDASNAPSFRSQILSSASHWNSRVANVKLAEGYPGDFAYYEGSDPSGSYASTDGHGSGYVLIDYDQATVYNPLRIVAHETGHVLGLPDHYSGPCSELMSGGGPGPSCTNSYPNSTEAANVNALWVNGFAPASHSWAKAAYAPAG